MKASSFIIISFPAALKTRPERDTDIFVRNPPTRHAQTISTEKSCILLIVILIFRKAYITIRKSVFFYKSGSSILASLEIVMPKHFPLNV